jgi:dihydrofolate reductase
MAARIVVTEFVSLDGVMEAPGGEDFKYPGWSFEFDRGDDGNQFKLDETMRADGLLIGRRTYDSFAGAWPHREGEFADKFNSMPKFVVSTTLGEPEWTNTTVLASGDATAQVRRLKEEFDGELQVPGSHRLVQELIESDLVDQINLMVFPVILGTGKKAFEATPERRHAAAGRVQGRRRRRPRARLRARRLRPGAGLRAAYRAQSASARTDQLRFPPTAVKVVGMSGCGNWSL